MEVTLETLLPSKTISLTVPHRKTPSTTKQDTRTLQRGHFAGFSWFVSKCRRKFDFWANDSPHK